jgi:ribosomal peptide maturation radical SAM protein 1
MTPKRAMGDIILISPPWALFNRPSIQLGTLKAYLNREFPDITVLSKHFYLKVAEHIGYSIYHEISQRTWLSETVFSALLYPSRFQKIARLFRKEAKGKPLVEKLDFGRLTRAVEEISQDFISAIKGENVCLIGISACVCQLTASLYLAQKLKMHHPHTPMVFGGSLFSGTSCRHLFEVFPEIDAVIIGEGELPLTHLIRWVCSGNDISDAHVYPGIVTGKTTDITKVFSFSQIPTLNQLPTPDFDDYFNLLGSFESEKHFFPVLPAEISRGCWYRTGQSGKASKGCNFCNLNLQWKGYRHKSAKKIADELDRLSSRHRLLSFAFMDNALPTISIKPIFSEIRDLKKEFRFFAEIRAGLPEAILSVLKTAGVEEVQIGIEALSTQMLRKLNKGTTAIQNIEIMKHCEALGIKNNSNLLVQFPGSDQTDIAETLGAIDFAMPFRPLKIVHFWLGLASPVCESPKTFGLFNVKNHPHYSSMFPESVHRKLRFMIQSYRSDRIYQKKLWKPVKDKVSHWEKTYGELFRKARAHPILFYEDGREFLIIRQRRVGKHSITHRLTGPSRKIYLFCGHARSIRRILAEFPRLTEDTLMPFLKMMTEKKLMFKDANKFLSLAVPLNKGI